MDFIKFLKVLMTFKSLSQLRNDQNKKALKAHIASL